LGHRCILAGKIFNSDFKEAHLRDSIRGESGTAPD